MIWQFFFPVWVCLFFLMRKQEAGLKLGWWVDKFRFLICHDSVSSQKFASTDFCLLESLSMNSPYSLSTKWMNNYLGLSKVEKREDTLPPKQYTFFPKWWPQVLLEYLFWLFSRYNWRKDCVPYFIFKNHQSPTFHLSYWPNSFLDNPPKSNLSFLLNPSNHHCWLLI